MTCPACAFAVDQGLLLGLPARYHSCGKVDTVADALHFANVALEDALEATKGGAPDDWVHQLSVRNALMALGNPKGWPVPPPGPRERGER